ncbi:TonB-dependent receptor-like protein [Nitrospirillum viridazoti]|uniref:TonB-dependent receptor n=2 Tax=Nitrospirillum TaxID=1543705 RepID=A0A248JRJ0_9PROT|nr:TonB-dependent receptor [Nitrospirillum amazonense CBAmc]TWB37980.1 TonB-dependent receptor-like protein [Nitrospirillum amazonense]
MGMPKFGRRALLLSSTMLVGALAAAADAAAQQSASASTDMQEIVVTGSRIKQAANLTSDSPLTTVDSIEMKLQGTTNVETMLNNLPGITAAQTNAQSNGATGTATINLRNLGEARTLVLIDGRRMPLGDPTYPYADVNFIPGALVESVDVVTGGASAVYGSDAVAGVVNFKMKRDFEGVKVDYQFSAAQHSNENGDAQGVLKKSAYPVTIPGDRFDGFVRDSSFVMGVNSPNNKGNVTAYATYRWTEPVTQATRDWSACTMATTSSNEDALATQDNQRYCSGSSNSAYARLRTNGSGTGYSLNPDGSASFVKYNSALAFNYGPYNYIQRQDERYTGGAFAHYEISPAFDVYTDFMFMSDHTKAQIAPSGFFSGTTYSINCDNPLMSASEATTLCGANAGSASATWKGYVAYRFTDNNAPRYDDLRHTDYRYVIGTRGDLGGGWSYDVYAQHSAVIYNETYQNDVSIAKLQNALLAKNVNGVATCESVISGTDTACVPINIFQLGKISSAAYNYVYTTSFKEGSTTQDIVSGTVSGDFGAWGVKSPFAKDAVAVALGSEWRRDAIDLKYSENVLSGDLSGSGAGTTQPAVGATEVKDIFGELRLPLVSDQPFIKDLSIDAGYRWSDYNLAGKANTYKASLNYAPISDVAFRGGYNHAVRAPNIIELFQTSTSGIGGALDPCSGSSPSASLAQCGRTGVTAAQYGNISECTSVDGCNTLSGGNKALKPETADTYTAGFVFTPTFMPNFAATVDYYNIKIQDLIGTVPTSQIMSQCLNTGNSYYCDLIHRGAAGSLNSSDGYFITTDINAGYRQQAGIDISGTYRQDLEDLGIKDLGGVTLKFIGSWTQFNRYQPLLHEAKYDCAGLYGSTCGQPTPHWRHQVRVTWNTPWNADLSVNWRYIGGTSLDNNSTDPSLNAGSGIYNNIDGKIAAYNYFDLAGTINLMDHYTLRFGVNNLFDKDPPIQSANDDYVSVLGTYGNGNTYPGIYDTLGRTFFLGITADF